MKRIIVLLIIVFSIIQIKTIAAPKTDTNKYNHTNPHDENNKSEDGIMSNEYVKIIGIDILFILLILGVRIYRAAKEENIEERNYSRIKDIRKDIEKLIRDVNTLKGQKYQGNNELDIKREISNLVAKITEIESIIKTREITQTIITKPKIEPVVKHTEDIFYQPISLGDGVFDDSSKTITPQDETVYRFMIDAKNKDVSSFEYFGDATKTNSVIFFTSKYLGDTCNIENPNAALNAARIVTLKKGIAERKGDKWIVSKENKAIIKYE